MNQIKVFSPATIGNVGPGFDVLGLAVKNLGDIVEAKRLSGGKIRIAAVHSPIPLSADPKKNTAALAAANVFKYLNIKGGIELTFTKACLSVQDSGPARLPLRQALSQRIFSMVPNLAWSN